MSSEKRYAWCACGHSQKQVRLEETVGHLPARYLLFTLPVVEVASVISYDMTMHLPFSAFLRWGPQDQSSKHRTSALHP